MPVHARLATPKERSELWPMFIDIWPAYATYIKRAGDREIRLFVLERRP